MNSFAKKMMLGTALAAVTLGGSVGVLVAQEKPVIATVVKISGIPWFDRMNTGVVAFQEANADLVASQSGPATADSAQQLQIVNDLVAKGVNALAVVPMDPAVLEGTLQRAMERGIVVVTHEADNQINTNANVEAFDNADYGAALNERLAECMGKEGKWTTFVGSLGSRTHMQWVGAGEENAKQYAGMQLVDANNESFDDANATYEKAKEILRKHPDIKGFQTSAGNDVLGVGRAIDEAGLSGKVCLVGTGLPNPSADLLESGAITAIGFWDPQKAGMAMNTIAKLLLEKKELTDGMDLGVPGYEKVTVKQGAGQGLLVVGNGMVLADKATYKDFLF
ncbi:MULTISPECIES: substrate-binding domain-containing protein [unclassified Agrobacterium]|uniref:substrate-binding domain-containing protein n=1 Tax=unclassified Agrobacterium TaxID=2632611 RepID=UPI00083DE46E|nr:MULTISPECIES: substrate-binding domain-containing protein [unclassified Agrobacterium]AOG12665.1 periplasmic binding domain protein [Agrobacterium sp. RAC06]MBU0834706.1 substrate-binding domain-containing protein [Alphaproteobacteria bacterium]QGG93530.1 substrate-binding domain-containing protein [Agrobacterium sp. MA01]